MLVNREQARVEAKFGASKHRPAPGWLSYLTTTEYCELDTLAYLYSRNNDWRRRWVHQPVEDVCVELAAVQLEMIRHQAKQHKQTGAGRLVRRNG